MGCISAIMRNGQNFPVSKAIKALTPGWAEREKRGKAGKACKAGNTNRGMFAQNAAIRQKFDYEHKKFRIN